MEKYNVVLFDPKTNVKSDNIETNLTREEATEIAITLRQDGIPAFLEKSDEVDSL